MLVSFLTFIYIKINHNIVCPTKYYVMKFFICLSLPLFSIYSIYFSLYLSLSSLSIFLSLSVSLSLAL